MNNADANRFDMTRTYAGLRNAALACGVLTNGRLALRIVDDASYKWIKE
jgi:hypothetical protein